MSYLGILCPAVLGQVNPQQYALRRIIGSPFPSAIDGSTPTATVGSPERIALDTFGNVYVADPTSHVIRKISPSGAVTSVAGLAGQPGESDGVGAAARFNGPTGIALDENSTVWVADRLNHTIRKIAPNGLVTTVAGKAGVAGFANGSGPDARFNAPLGVAVDAFGNVLVADSKNDVVRAISSDGSVTTVAGAPGVAGSTDGSVNVALFTNPTDVAVAPSGAIYVAQAAAPVRQILNGQVTTLSKSCQGVGVDPSGEAYCFESDDTFDQAGTTIYVADAAAGAVEKSSFPLPPSGHLEILAGGNRSPVIGGVAVLGTDLYYSGAITEIRRLATDGTDTLVSTLGPFDHAVGANGQIFGGGCPSRCRVVAMNPDGTFWQYIFDPNNYLGPATAKIALAVTPDGTIFFSNVLTIQQIATDRTVTTIAGTATASGTADGTGNLARFSKINGMTIDASGNLWVTDGQRIRRVTQSGDVTTIAGSTTAGFADGTGSAAQFSAPAGIATDVDGTFLIVDKGNRAIRRMTPTGDVSTVVGPSAASSVPHDGTGIDAVLNAPWSLAVSGDGTIFVSDHDGVSRGRRAIDDAAVIDAANGPVGEMRQLSTSASNATAWQWSVVRKPATSNASLSSSIIANPTFIPDVPDLYTFKLDASSVAGERVSYVSVQGTEAGTCTPPAATLAGPSSVCAGQDASISIYLTGAAPWVLTWSDGAIQTVTAQPDVRVVSPSVTTSYRVESIADANCSVTQNSNSVTITPLTLPAMTLSAPTAVVANETSVAGVAASTALMYFWSISSGTITSATNANPVTFTPGTNAGTTLSVRGTDAFGCSTTATASMMVVESAGTIRGDANGDNTVTPVDVFYLINYLFAGGPPP